MMRNKFVNKDWYAMNISRFVGESFTSSGVSGVAKKDTGNRSGM